jgi:hypothetical protein
MEPKDTDMTVIARKTSGMRMNSIAPCGMNCYLCRALRPDKKTIRTCPGCRSDGEGKPEYCQRCIIKNCEKMEKGGFKYCFNCDSFPCTRLKNLDKRYRTRYGLSMLDNLENIKKNGIRHFIRTEKEKWTCPECGETLIVHKPHCLKCGYEWLKQ